MPTHPIGENTVNRTVNIDKDVDALLGQLSAEGDVSRSLYVKVLIEEAVRTRRVISRAYADRILGADGLLE